MLLLPLQVYGHSPPAVGASILRCRSSSLHLLSFLFPFSLPPVLHVCLDRDFPLASTVTGLIRPHTAGAVSYPKRILSYSYFPFHIVFLQLSLRRQFWVSPTATGIFQISIPKLSGRVNRKRRNGIVTPNIDSGRGVDEGNVCVL